MAPRESQSAKPSADPSSPNKTQNETAISVDGSRQSGGDNAKNFDDWLPITASRQGKWWYSTFHNVTAMVGAGVLGLPSAMSFLGWEGGIVVLISSWAITLYTLWQMVEMHEMVPGKRFDRYHELGQHAFGPKLGLSMVVPQQLMVSSGFGIVYMLTGGESLQKFYSLIKCPDMKIEKDTDIHCGHIGKSAWIIIFASQHFFFSQLPNFNSISGVSLAAAIMSVCYSTIAWAAPLHHGQYESPADYSFPGESSASMVFGAFNALGTVAFAYAGHNVVLEIQANIPSTPEKPSKIAMWRGVVMAYIIVAVCYFPVAIVGYWAFGNAVKDNILLSLGKPRWLIAMANIMVVVHVTGSFQVYAMPVFDIFEGCLVKGLGLPPSTLLRIGVRSSYVVMTAFVACSLPFFGSLLGFLGGIALAPMTYFLPCMMWLKTKKPKPGSKSWLINWFLIVVGVLLMLTSSVGGLRGIVINASNYKIKSYH